MKSIQKIVVLGPESTGKSTLCAALAAHYQTLWTPNMQDNFYLNMEPSIPMMIY